MIRVLVAARAVDGGFPKSAIAPSPSLVQLS